MVMPCLDLGMFGLHPDAARPNNWRSLRALARVWIEAKKATPFFWSSLLRQKLGKVVEAKALANLLTRQQFGRAWVGSIQTVNSPLDNGSRPYMLILACLLVTYSFYL
jgi:hypothetical protein